MPDPCKHSTPGPRGRHPAPADAAGRGPTGSGKPAKPSASTPGPTGTNEPEGRRWTDILWVFAGFQYVDGLRIDDATPEQAKLIAKAHARGKLHIEAALKRLEAARSTADATVAEHFLVRGTTIEDVKVLDRLIVKFKKLQEDFPKATYEVDQSKEPQDYAKDCYNWLRGKKKFNRAASVHKLVSRTGIGDIHILWPNFAGKKSNLDGQARTLVHEQAHYSLWAGDKGYYGSERDKYLALSQKDRLDNADCYGMFAMHAYLKPAAPLVEFPKTGKKLVVTPKTSADQCDSVHDGSSCLLKKGHAGNHKGVLGNAW